MSPYLLMEQPLRCPPPLSSIGLPQVNMSSPRFREQFGPDSPGLQLMRIVGFEVAGQSLVFKGRDYVGRGTGTVRVVSDQGAGWFYKYPERRPSPRAAAAGPTPLRASPPPPSLNRTHLLVVKRHVFQRCSVYIACGSSKAF